MQVKSKIIYSALFCFLALLFVVAVFALGIYRFSWDGPTTRGFLRVIPLPAATVNNDFVSFREINERADIYQRLAENQTNFDFSSPEGRLELANQRSNIFQEIVKDKIIADLAREYKVSISSEIVDEYYRHLLESFRISESRAGEEIQRLFGISEKKFKQAFVVPDLLRSHLRVAFFKQQTNSVEYRKIMQAGSSLRNGLDFVRAAEMYSDDEQSKYIGGELGAFSRADLGPWLSRTAFELGSGQYSGIIVSPDGYHILQAVTRDEQTEKVTLRHIFIPGPNFDEYFETQRQTYKVYTFKKI